MLIKDFDGSSLAKYNKASRMLESLYGIKISKSNDLNKLREGLSNANGIITKLKEQNKAINDRDVLKYTLISEALQDLIDFENKTRIDELDSSYSDSIKYKQILSWLADYCTKCMDIGDSMEDSVYDAMKQYRSSQYRFPDAQVESDLYEYIMSKSEGCTSNKNLLDSMSPETIQEMLDRMEEACNSDKIDESDNTDLLEFAKAVAEGDFYHPENDNDTNPIGKSQQDRAKAYLAKMGSSLSLADEPANPMDKKATSTAKPHPKQRFYNPE